MTVEEGIKDLKDLIQREKNIQENSSAGEATKNTEKIRLSQLEDILKKLEN